ncbi:MAG: hypothetical protein AAB288_04030, partial [Acidobacteriota bacterium]
DNVIKSALDRALRHGVDANCRFRIVVLNNYTKKIIIGLAIAIAGCGAISLVVGIYASEVAFVIIGVMLLATARMGYGVGKS